MAEHDLAGPSRHRSMSILADLPLNSLFDRIGKPLAWWIGELRSMQQEVLRRIASVCGRDITIEAGEDHWIIRRGAHLLGEIGWQPGNEPASQRRLRDLLGSAVRHTPVHVELGADRVLSKTIVLPVAARAELDRIVPFEIARHFPFPADRVFYRHRIVGSASGAATRGNSLSVEIVVVPRDLVLTIADRLRRAGLRLGGVALATSTGEAQLLLSPDAVPAAMAIAPRRKLLVAVWLIALLALISWPLAQQFRLAVIEREIAALKPAAEAAQRTRQAHQRAFDQASDIARLLAARPPLIAVLDALSRDLPDDTWLTSLSIAGHDVSLEGLSRSAATIALALGRDANFTGVSFRSPIARDATSEREHFQLGATISEKRR